MQYIALKIILAGTRPEFTRQETDYPKSLEIKHRVTEGKRFTEKQNL